MLINTHNPKITNCFKRSDYQRLIMAIVVSTKKSDGSSWGEVCGITFGGCALLGILGFALYNFIMNIIAVIGFTNEDVENVCPNSELLWWALFIGIIWPFLLSNNAKQNADKN